MVEILFDALLGFQTCYNFINCAVIPGKQSVLFAM